MWSKDIRYWLVLATTVGLVLLGIIVLVLGPGKGGGEVADPGAAAEWPEEQAKAWGNLCSAYDGWFGRLGSDLGKVEGDKWLKDSYLCEKVIAKLESAKARKIELDPRRIARAPGRPLSHLQHNPPDSARTPEASARTLQALGVVNQIEQALKQWPSQGSSGVAVLAARFDERGWHRQASYVQSLLAGATPGHGASLVSAVARVLDEAPAIEEIETEWAELQELSNTIEAAGDPIMAKFGSFLLAETVSEQGPGTREDIEALLSRVQELKEVARELAAFVAGNWQTKVDRNAFAAAREVVLPADGVPTRHTLITWLKEVNGYIALKPDPRDAWSGTGRIAETADQIEMLAREYGGDEEANAFSQKLADINGRVDGLMDRNAVISVEKNRAAILYELESLDKALLDVGEQVKLALLDHEPPGPWLEGIRQQDGISASQAINAQWRTRRDSLLDGVTAERLKDDIHFYSDLRGALKTLHGVLRDLDTEENLSAGLPNQEKLAKPWQQKLVGAAARRRERALEDCIKLISWQGGVPDVEAPRVQQGLTAARQAFKAWMAQASELIAAFDTIESRLDNCYLQDDAPDPQAGSVRTLLAGAQNSAALRDKDVEDAVAPIVQRIAYLSEIATSTDRARLAELVQAEAPGRPEVPLAAWRRLGRISGPPWPASLAELDVERELRRKLAGLAGGIGDGARGETLRRELAAEGHRRWLICYGSLSGSEDVETALSGRHEFAVDDAALAPSILYNISLYDLKGIDPKAADAQAVSRIQQFLQKVNSLPGEVTSQPDVAALMPALDEIAKDESSRQKAGDLANAGPAGPGLGGGWTAEVFEDGTYVDYKWEEEGHSLRFMRIDPQGGAERAAYLCTTEMPVGLFIDVVAEVGKWDEARVLFKDILDRFNVRFSVVDPRKGPRVWSVERDMSGLRLSNEWLSSPYYPAGRFPSPPGESHPMQFVPPAAALYAARLLGCRLPSAAEWRAAYDSFERDNPADAWNLRDATWTLQQEHIREVIRPREPGVPPPPAQWPDESIFWPPDTTVVRKVGDEAGPATTEHDGALWFFPVTSGRERTFQHLVGNVAEWVFDAADGLEDMEHIPPESAGSFTQNNSGRFRVIGGSALSPPELRPFDKPWPVDFESAGEGYSDVGFRLCFSGPTSTKAQRLRAVLRNRSYLPARPRAK